MLPSERLSNVNDVVREAIVASEFPRLITALGPVLVRNVDHLNLKKLHLQLAEGGLERRLAWVVENTLEAIRREAPGVTSAPWRAATSGRASCSDRFSTSLPINCPLTRWQRTCSTRGSAVRRPSTRSPLLPCPFPRRWGIITTLQPDDFVEALRGARAAGR